MHKVRNNYYREITVKREIIWGGITVSGLITGASAVLFCLALFTEETRACQKTNSTVFISLISLIGIGLFLWTLLVLKNDKIILERDYISRTRFGRTTRVKLADVLSAKWYVVPSRKILLVTENTVLKLSLDLLSTNQTRHLILYFRRHLSPELQTGWEKFGPNIAFHILKSHKPNQAEINETIALAEEHGLKQFTAGDWFQATIMISLIVEFFAGILALILQDPHALILGVMIFFLGTVGAIAKHYDKSPRPDIPPDMKKFFKTYTLFAFLGGVHVGTFIWILLNYPEHTRLWGLPWFFIGFLVYPLFGYYLKKKSDTSHDPYKNFLNAQWKQVQLKYGI